MDWLITEWLILVLVTPLIIVIVVLLYGFVGCTFPDVTFAPDAPTTSPNNFTATANATDKIDLKWQHPSPTALFTLTRTSPTAQVIASGISTFSVQDPGLNDGTDFSYSLTAKDGAAAPSVPIEAQATTKPNAPTNLKAIPEDVNQIVLDWNHATRSNKTIKFKIKNIPKTPPGSSTEFSTSATQDPANPTRFTFMPPPVPEGSEQEYQVTAFVVGFDGKEIVSDPSGVVSAKPLAFKADFTTNQSQTIAPGNYCFVQRISAANLHNSGSQVTLVVRGSQVNNVKINSLYISQPGAGNAWNSAADIKPVIAAPLTLPDDQPESFPVPYTLDKASDLIIAFDFTSSAGHDQIRFVSAPPVKLYFKPNVQQAPQQNRDADYTTQADPRFYLVDKIDVS